MAKLSAALIFAAAAALTAAFAGSSVAREKASSPRHAILLDVRGAIGPATTEYLRQGFGAAAERNAALVILRMDTPGGLDSAMRDIVRDILASPIPVVTYVSPSGARAASAGTYILYASHLAAMAPGTNLGAATPVQLGGGQPFGGGSEDGKTDGKKAPADARTAKAVNDAVAYIRGLAEIHGRNAEWAERAVREAASLSASTALEQHVIEVIASDLQDLLAKANGRIVRLGQQQVRLDTAGLSVTAVEPDWRARLLATITDPNIAYLLLLVGIYGILFEVMSPGTIFSGVIGAVCLLVGLFALNLLPINYAGIGLLALGIALMAAEALVPSFGVLGIGGAVAFAIGSLLMFDGNVPGFTLSLPVVLTATAASAALLLLAFAAALRSHRRAVATGDAGLLGRSGEVLRWSGEQGEIRVHGERWHARAAVPLLPGQQVRVVAREGLTLVVEPVPDQPI
ncbi:MAG: nodulation protein NfeD [Pseudomonadota bacterium]|nr:nodulation protein NfeD [Pseudomonadota bacterium]